jgi:calcium/proton exchanger cax
MLGAFAVRDGHVKFVQGLIVGSLIHRLLLILGMSVAIHSKGSKTSKMEDRSARVASSILYMGIVIMIMPSLFMISSPDSGVGGLLKISRWCAIFLLILLGFYFLFSIKTHDKFWDESSLVRTQALSN